MLAQVIDGWLDRLVIRDRAIGHEIGRNMGQDAEGESFELRSAMVAVLTGALQLLYRRQENRAPCALRGFERPQINLSRSISQLLEQSSEEMGLAVAGIRGDDELRLNTADGGTRELGAGEARKSVQQGLQRLIVKTWD